MPTHCLNRLFVFTPNCMNDVWHHSARRRPLQFASRAPHVSRTRRISVRAAARALARRTIHDDDQRHYDRGAVSRTSVVVVVVVVLAATANVDHAATCIAAAASVACAATRITLIVAVLVCTVAVCTVARPKWQPR